MKNKKANWISYVIWIYLFLGSLFDVITSFSIHFLGSSMPIVLGIKVLFLIFLFGLQFYIKNKKGVCYSIILGLYFCFFMLFVFWERGSSVLFLEAQNLFRTFYFPLVFVYLYSLYKRELFEIKVRYLSYLLFIYLIFLIVPEMFNLGFSSYAHSKIGGVGWFNSTNEIGGILAILGPFLLVYLKEKSLLVLVFGVIIYLFGILVLGTKVPVLSFFIMIFIFLFSFFKKLWNEGKKRIILFDFIILLVGLVGFSFLLVQSSFYKNVQTHLDFLGINEIGDLFTFHHIDHFIFSERLSFWSDTHASYVSSSFSDKFLGMGITEINGSEVINRKMIEMDYMDIFYHYGVLGTILFFYPLWILVQRRKWQLEEKISVFLIILLSFFSGHILVAPSVSILVALVCIPKKEYEVVV